MAWLKGFNFRTTLGYVTDGANDVLCNGGRADSPSFLYPSTINGIISAGWLNTGTDQDRDRNAGLDPRLAGTAFHTPGSAMPLLFQIDLPATGDYDIRLACGDAYGGHGTGFVEIRDNTTAKITIDHASGFTTSGTRWRDATDTLYSDVTWPGSNTAVRVTFATTTFILALGKYGAADGWIAHVSLDQVVAAGGALAGVAGSSGVYAPRGTTQPIASGWA